MARTVWIFTDDVPKLSALKPYTTGKAIVAGLTVV